MYFDFPSASAAEPGMRPLLRRTLGRGHRLYATLTSTTPRIALFLLSLFALRLACSLAIQHLGWLPTLNRSGGYSSYDAERYLANSLNYIKGVAVPPMYWTGTLVYYGWIFRILGQSTTMALLVNNVFSASAALVTWIAASRFSRLKPSLRWVSALFVFSPELLWFDSITSKESPLTSLILLWAITFILCFGGCRGLWRNIVVHAALSLLTLFIVEIRLPLALPLAFSVIFCALHWLVHRSASLKVLLATLIGGLLTASLLLVFCFPAAWQYIESVYSRVRDVYLFGGGQLSAAYVSWSPRSLGHRLIPRTMLEAVAYFPIRLTMDLVAPLPGLRWSWAGLSSGSWVDWQSLSASLGAFFNLFLVPLSLASGIDCLKGGPKPEGKLFIILCSLYASIALGNIIIEERYRVMAIPLLFLTALIGTKARYTSRRIGFTIWMTMLLATMIMYVSTKFF